MGTEKRQRMGRAFNTASRSSTSFSASEQPGRRVDWNAKRRREGWVIYRVALKQCPDRFAISPSEFQPLGATLDPFGELRSPAMNNDPKTMRALKQARAQQERSHLAWRAGLYMYTGGAFCIYNGPLNSPPPAPRLAPKKKRRCRALTLTFEDKSITFFFLTTARQERPYCSSGYGQRPDSALTRPVYSAVGHRVRDPLHPFSLSLPSI
ncbi:hypothetical protein MRX96_059571 [Rhipicephalus microplus]